MKRARHKGELQARGFLLRASLSSHAGFTHGGPRQALALRLAPSHLAQVLQEFWEEVCVMMYDELLERRQLLTAPSMNFPSAVI